MSLNELRDKAYRNAVTHGFHNKELSNEHCLCLVISELMEAVEADRKGKRSSLPMRMKSRITMPISSIVLKNISKTVWGTSLLMHAYACLTCVGFVR